MKIINGLAVFEDGHKSNKPVIFIHGFPFDHTMWQNQVEFLKNNRYCVTYDVRGLGQSDAGDGQYTIESFTDDLLQIVDELKLNKPVLCGLSMGGYIALRAVQREQKRFGGLVLMSTKASQDDNDGKLKRAEGIKKINTQGVEKYVAGMMPNCFCDLTMQEMKEVYDETLNKAVKYNPTGVKGCLLAMAGRLDLESFLMEIEVPALVICGSLDKIVLPGAMREISEKIKDSEFAATPRAGHITPLENPEFINDILSGFLNRRVK
ncbi:MAG: alpha/beta fold hydrolase [Ignavibacteria bacterium]|jgi:pimeloyl-ACP methyl ester carboxylesterase|nr:alpha/beta fold hydrolase [Ignavibacteria bacterium]MCU7503254.1 alpha/beta fold hydrolase [Ignavibacteria bacterium]MCU7515800.1 alpha/beta fold hydrolase [Ignavibacteria bacterium]